MQEIILGDCLDVMKTYKENFFTSVVTDPPYGLKFMGKGWDHGIPGVEYWAEALRVTKPGGYFLAFGGTRTYHRLTCAIEDAGWEIRDCIMWLYGQGFPKSHNKFGLDGYGTALKPSYETIIVAMKKCEGTYIKNVEKWGLGGINIDDCRIWTTDTWKRNNRGIDPGMWIGLKGNEKKSNDKGRWPTNVILDQEAGRMLDDQTGILTSGKIKPLDHLSKNKVYSKRRKANINEFEASSGGASRFFYCAKTSSSERNAGCDDLDDKIGGGLNATVCGDTRTGNVTIQKNNHPTVKPLKLMKYLLTLVSPPENTLILDPFCGSGSTIVAAKELGLNAIGIEKEKDYYEIANARLHNT